jgi:hypothetical protein
VPHIARYSDGSPHSSPLPYAPDRNAYYHPSFIKGKRDLCRYIRRVKYKGTGPRKPSRPEEQPNFYLSRNPFNSTPGPDDAFSRGTPSKKNGGIPPLLGPSSPRRSSFSTDASFHTFGVSHPTAGPELLAPTSAGLGRWAHPGLGGAHPPSLFSFFVEPRTARSPGCWLQQLEGSCGGVGWPMGQPPPPPPPYHPVLRAAMGAPRPVLTLGPQHRRPSVLETSSLLWEEEKKDENPASGPTPFGEATT